MTVKTITRIHLFWDGNRSPRARIATVEGGRTHGLGHVGEPIGKYLGDRAEGYEIALPDDLDDLVVFYVHDDREPDARGYFPKSRVGLDALGAPDLEEEEER